MMPREVVFEVTNKHATICGTPPHIDANTPNRYHSYFENVQGEQLIFVFVREADTGTLYHGDMGWDHPQPVEEGGRCPNLILDEAETLWLRACWLAATAFRRFRKE